MSEPVAKFGFVSKNEPRAKPNRWTRFFRGKRQNLNLLSLRRAKSLRWNGPDQDTENRKTNPIFFTEGFQFVEAGENGDFWGIQPRKALGLNALSLLN